MKNLVIVVLVLLLVALGVFVVKREGITSVKQLVDTVEKKVENVASSAGVSTGSVSANAANIPPAMANLPADTAFSFVLPSSAFILAVDHVSNLLQKVKESSVGKKLEIEKMITEGMSGGMPGSNPSGFGGSFGDAPPSGDFELGGEGSPSNQGFPSEPGIGAAGAAGPKIEEALKVIRNFDKFEVLVRAKTLEGKSTPLVKVNAAFKDEEYSNQLKGLLEMGLMQSKEQPSGPQLTKDAQDPETYIFNVKPPQAPVEVMGRVKAAGKEITATIGVIAGPSPASATSTQQSPDTVVAQAAISPKAAGTYFNVGAFRNLVDVFAGLIPGEEEKQQLDMARKAIDSALGNYSSISGTAVFDKGFTSKSCSRFVPGGLGFEPFKRAVENNASSKSTFYKLIGPRTTFALRVDGALTAAVFESMTSSMTAQTALLANSEMAAATGQLLAQLKLAQEEIKKLKLVDVGLVANAPTSSFVPDVGVYIEHAPGLTIDDFGNTLRALFTKLAPPSVAAENPIVIGKDASGQTQVSFPAVEGYQLIFKSISPTQFLGSIQEPFFEEVKSQMASAQPFLDDSKLASKGVSLQLAGSDTYYYLSSSSTMPLVRQFAPFLTMSRPDLKITDGELTQFLDLFDFNMLVVGKNSVPEESVLCSEGKAAVY